MEHEQNNQFEVKSFDNPFERIALLQENYHFIPINVAEAGRVLALNAFITKPDGTPIPYGTAKFFHTVQLRQMAIKKAKQSVSESDKIIAEEIMSELGDQDVLEEVHSVDFDPNAAVRSVANEFINYYRSARFTVFKLKKLSNDLKNQYNPQTSLEKAFKPGNLGLASLIRYLDLRNLIREQAIKKDCVNPLKIEYLNKPTPEVLEYVRERTDQLNVGQIRHVVAPALDEQRVRNMYWHNRLHEGESHLIAKPLIQTALRRYPMQTK